ncbi:MAG: U32 family peptidase [Oscillospiraceae bacterium]|nr:U32 family peptidase [Oscillospiraceae bacterium]
MTDIEILSPAGDEERLDAAVLFGADAVYLAGKSYGMRGAPANFTLEQLKKACDKTHALGKKVYLTVNILPSNSEADRLEGYIKEAYACGIDAAIVSDIGSFALIKKAVPDLALHVSTQAGIVNYLTARTFYEMGAKRVVLARELSLDDIAEIRAKTPKELEIECFVHGAMCVSFSGRCLLSQYLTGRNANRGECAQPCRWSYSLVEETRPNEYYQISEDEKGSYILNAKDLCMIEHLDKLAKAGVTSFKIEGRAKSAYYVSVVTNAYIKAKEILCNDPDNYVLPEWIKNEVFKVSHRKYCTGFYFGHPNDCQYYQTGGYERICDVVAVVEGYDSGMLRCSQRNRFFEGDQLELLIPDSEPIKFTANEIYDDFGERVQNANKATMKLSIPFDMEIPAGSIIRKEITSEKAEKI